MPSVVHMSLTDASGQQNGLGPDSAPHRSYYTMLVSRLMQKYDLQSRQTTTDQRCAAISQVIEQIC